MEVEEGSLMTVENALPDHFLDEDFMDVKTNRIHPGVFKHFHPTLGLLLKIRRGARHVCHTSVKHNAKGRDVHEDTPALLWQLWHCFVWPGSFDSEKWSPSLLFWASEELRVRSKYLNGNLETALGQHLLLPTTKEQGLIFDPKLIKMVMVYHNNLERPEGTFAVIDRDAQAKEEALEKRLKLSELSALPRDECSSCMSRKQVYCGECKGVRMANAEHLLPPRVTLPFDVLLLIDWHETLHKCTGVHAAALSKTGTVTVQQWHKSGRPKDPENSEDLVSCGWATVVQTFDVTRDIILFPGADSINIQDLAWPDRGNGSDRVREEQQLQLEEGFHKLSVTDSSLNITNKLTDTDTTKKPYRLILIESTWNAAQTIVNYIQRVRAALNLPPLRCVALPESVNGLYWKLQHVGSSAVSTIEALSHAARAAGCPEVEAEHLLTLFFLQRYRLLKRLKSGDGRPPRAVDVRGPWRVYKT